MPTQVQVVSKCLAQRQKLISPVVLVSENQWASAANSPVKFLTNNLFDTLNAKESLCAALLSSPTLEWADAEIKQKQYSLKRFIDHANTLAAWRAGFDFESVEAISLSKLSMSIGVIKVTPESN